MTVCDAVKQGIAYIEAHLLDDIGVADVAGAVCYSQFYFSRQFSIHTHTSVYEYILKRKLSESYKCLFAERPRIVDLALRYGFASHEVYTRAFRKMFGENPSEASAYKKLLVCQAIDDRYLDFLCGLNVEIIESPVSDCFFEADGPADTHTKGDLLMLLSGDDLCDMKCVLKGRVTAHEGKTLSFRLRNMKHKIRVHHGDTALSARYFFEHFYDPAGMPSNFVLVKTGEAVDILVPES